LSERRVHLPGLDGLRFLAALLVVVHHVELQRETAGLANHWDVTFVHRVGGLGVTLFFVLSGFLITYLLMEERARTGTIRVGKFYVRRMLRIWPLYYVLVGLGFFVFPRLLVSAPELRQVDDRFGAKLALYALLCPNVAYVLWRPIPLAAHLWSVGSEEQFYLAWPWLVRAARERVLVALGAVIVAVGTLRWGFQSGALGEALGAPDLGLTIGRFLDAFRVDCMAIGGVGAYALHRGTGRALGVVFHPAFQIIAFAVLAAMLAFGRVLPTMHHQTYAALFLVVILNVSSNPRRLVSLDHAFFRFMGRISYGLYMYHPAAIATVLVVGGTSLSGMSRLGADIAVYAGALLLTTAVAAASYYGLERPFLRWKDRFAVVATGDGARDEMVEPRS
jgi:peptidoglycan/LPS O-acetylase OafA/YrhL